MKYIRTKDGRIIDITKENYIVNGNDLILHRQYETYGGPEIKPCDTVALSIAIIQKHNEYSFVGEIDNQADTIEELCDEFVGIDSHGHYIIHNDEWLDGARIIPLEEINYYGAIWTDKGLIYVAKMNEKGVLELL